MTTRVRWETAKSVGTAPALEEFLARCSTGMLADSARAALEQTRFAHAESVNTKESYQCYLDLYPRGRNSKKAGRALEQLCWNETIEDGGRMAYANYLRLYPDGAHKSEAEAAVEAVDFDAARRTGTAEAYRTFLQAHPSGRLVGQARAALEELAWAVSRASNTIESYATFLRDYGHSDHAIEAQTALNSLYLHAPPRKGSLGAVYPKLECIPAWCKQARVLVDNEADSIAAILQGDVWGAHPALAGKYQSDLERQEFGKSAAADSLREAMKKEAPALLAQKYAIGFAPVDSDKGRCAMALEWFSDFDTVASCFEISLSHHYEYRDVVQGIAFGDHLGSSTDQGTRLLRLHTDSPTAALQVERLRHQLEVWVCFGLTGKVFEGEYDFIPEADGATILLVDREAGRCIQGEFR